MPRNPRDEDVQESAEIDEEDGIQEWVGTDEENGIQRWRETDEVDEIQELAEDTVKGGFALYKLFQKWRNR